MVVAENDGAVTVCVTLSVTLSVGTCRALSITLTLNTSSNIPGKNEVCAHFVTITYYADTLASATAGSDYTELSEKFNLISANTTGGDKECYNISIIDDSVYESNEMFTVSIATSDHVLIGNNMAIITITDNEEG